MAPTCIWWRTHHGQYVLTQKDGCLVGGSGRKARCGRNTQCDPAYRKTQSCGVCASLYMNYMYEKESKGLIDQKSSHSRYFWRDKWDGGRVG